MTAIRLVLTCLVVTMLVTFLQACTSTKQEPAASITAPTVTGIDIAQGAAGGGDAFMLTGSGFSAGTTVSVQFGTNPATGLTVVDDTMITGLTPAGTASEVVTVTVTTDGGSASLTNSFTYGSIVVAAVDVATGPAGGGTTVVLTGLGFDDLSGGAPTVSFGSNAATAVTLDSDIQLTVVSPAGTQGTTVAITVTNANGTGRLLSAFTFDPFLVTTVSPNSGHAQGGTAITISGVGFATGAPAVTFGANAATNVTVVDDATITCTSPADASESVVAVSVTNNNGTASLNTSFTYGVYALNGIAPVQGVAIGGTTVTLNGEGFLGSTPTITIGGSVATGAVVVDDNTITCVTPSGTAGNVVDVVLTTGSGSMMLSAAFTYTGVNIASLNPVGGPSSGGTNVTITGAGFNAANLAVTFGGLSVSNATIVDDATITCTSPTAAVPGTVVDVTVTNDNGTHTLVQGWTYDPLILVSVTPAAGPAAGGTAVTLAGIGFNNGVTSVSFGGAAATNVVVVSDTQVTCETPAGTQGAVVSVSVTNDNGTNMLANAFTYDTFTLASVNPANGPVAGGNTLTLSGTGFMTSGGVTTVFFGLTQGSNLTIMDDMTLMVDAPAGVMGQSVSVSIVSSNGTATLNNAYAYDNLTLSAITPDTGSDLGGDIISLFGVGLDDGAVPTVLFGATPATNVAVLSDNGVTATSPAGVDGTMVDVSIMNSNGTAVIYGAFTYQSAPPASSLFDADKATAMPAEDIQFEDMTTNATEWVWDFGDGTTSFAQHPLKNYVSAGEYTVSLTINQSTNPQTSDAKIIVGEIGVGMGAGSYPTIQAAIDAAQAFGNSIIAIGPGIYEEALVIDGNVSITLAGDKRQTVLRPLSITGRSLTLPTEFRTVFPVIDLGDVNQDGAGLNATLTLNGLTIDGSATIGSTGNHLYGVLSRPGANLTIENCRIQGIWKGPADFSADTPVGVYAWNGGATGRTLSISKSSFALCQEACVRLESSSLAGSVGSISVSIVGCEFVGHSEAASLISQSNFGIQLGALPVGGAGTTIHATVQNNNFVGFGLAGPQAMPHGALVNADNSIGYALQLGDLNASSSLNLTGNSFADCQGIASDINSNAMQRFDLSGVVNNNTIIGGRWACVGALSQTRAISGMRADDPNHLNWLMASISLSNPAGDFISLGGGTYSLTLPMLEPSVAQGNPTPSLTFTSAFGAEVNIPNASLPANVSAGSGVTVNTGQ